MGDPGLLQERPYVSALLSQAGGYGEQAAAAERTLAGLHAMADLPLDHRRAQCSLGGIIGGFYALDFPEGSERFLGFHHSQAGAHRFGPWRLLPGLAAQLHRPVQHLLKGNAEGPAAMMQLVSIDSSVLPPVPLLK
jgi:hypothetical protein